MKLDEMLFTDGNNPMHYDSDNDECINKKSEKLYEQLLNEEDCQEILLPGTDENLKDSDDPIGNIHLT